MGKKAAALLSVEFSSIINIDFSIGLELGCIACRSKSIVIFSPNPQIKTLFKYNLINIYANPLGFAFFPSIASTNINFTLSKLISFYESLKICYSCKAYGREGEKEGYRESKRAKMAKAIENKREFLSWNE